MKRLFGTLFFLFAAVSGSTSAQAAPVLPEEDIALQLVVLGILEEEDSVSTTAPGLPVRYICTAGCWYDYKCPDVATTQREKDNVDTVQCATSSTKAETKAVEDCNDLKGKKIFRGEPRTECTIEKVVPDFSSANCGIETPVTSCTP